MDAEHPIRRTKTAREVAQRLGMHPRTVQRIIAEPRGQYLARAAHRRKRILELRRAGWPLAAIATEVGMSTGGVGVTLHHLRKAGVELPTKHQKARKRELKTS